MVARLGGLFPRTSRTADCLNPQRVASNTAGGGSRTVRLATRCGLGQSALRCIAAVLLLSCFTVAAQTYTTPWLSWTEPTNIGPGLVIDGDTNVVAIQYCISYAADTNGNWNLYSLPPIGTSNAPIPNLPNKSWIAMKTTALSYGSVVSSAWSEPYYYDTNTWPQWIHGVTLPPGKIRGFWGPSSK